MEQAMVTLWVMLLSQETSSSLVNLTGQKAKLASGSQLAWLLLYASGVSGLVLRLTEPSEVCGARKDTDNMWQLPLAGLEQGT